jgi:hypothetical protein
MLASMGTTLAFQMSSEAHARAATGQLLGMGAEVSTSPWPESTAGHPLIVDVRDEDAGEANRIVRSVDPGAVYVGSDRRAGAERRRAGNRPGPAV